MPAVLTISKYYIFSFISVCVCIGWDGGVCVSHFGGVCVRVFGGVSVFFMFLFVFLGWWWGCTCVRAYMRVSE